MVLKKRGAVYSVIALMLCVAVYLNWSYNRTEDDLGPASSVDGKIIGESTLVDGVGTGEPEVHNPAVTTSGGSGSDYFSQARLSRQKARDEAVSILNATIENENAAEDAKNQANDSIQTLADCAVREARIENLVIAKGYVDCVVFINDNGVNVIVSQPNEGLQSTDVAKIKDIVLSEIEISAEKVKIIPTT